ncbi:hypothetical protein [Pontibacter liquoris]|uniref:hypothetical protein n=1 Tax=Pontibacter liquoris TaxID=2905677 RepID=UPI001FA78B0E|nr:hypothetical protein [Pontibacter liquoris]
MQNRRFYRIVLTIVCFVFAGLNGYKIMMGNYSKLDIFLTVVFLVFGILYLVMLLRKQDL